ncbi:hypothetical protein AALB81_05545 [Lachnospiraceae bacterium 48-33]|jgi:hypothetical protein
MQPAKVKNSRIFEGNEIFFYSFYLGNQRKRWLHLLLQKRRKLQTAHINAIIAYK